MRARSIVRLSLTLLLGFCVLASTGLTPTSIGASQQDSVQQSAVQQRPLPPRGPGAFVPDEVVIQYRPNAPEVTRQNARARVGAVAKERVSRPGHGTVELASVPPG